ncbi:MAG TPA: hypothetical protein VFM25_02005 [Verrucomicrobiae bacterium]|nr:hypothetical protein [Verrucomicrobiae bacterium]
MENAENAYWALCAEIRKDEARAALPLERRILSLGDFIDNCLTNGFSAFDCNGRWSIVPAAELMDEIDEPVFAKELRACIAICREYGKKVGRDPFDYTVEYVSLDEETENKISAREFDFTDYADPEITERLCRKTIDYFHKHHE